MHECPECGCLCYCSGDIDDCPVYSEEWAWMNCIHPTTQECDQGFEDNYDPYD